MIDYSVIKKTMQSFSFGSLKSFLGEDLVDSLIEWTQEGESVYTKAKLTQLILTVKGLRLLKEKDFRKQLLLHYKPDKKLYDFVQYLPLKANETDLNKIIELIVDVPWRVNAVSNLFLNLFNLDSSILVEEK